MEYRFYFFRKIKIKIDRSSSTMNVVQNLVLVNLFLQFFNSFFIRLIEIHVYTTSL